MTSTYTANSGIEKPATGDQSGTWGDTLNINMDIVDRVMGGVGPITLTGTTHTLLTTDGALSEGMYRVLVLGGSPSGTNTITVSPNDQDKMYLVYNNSGQSAIFTQGSGGNVTVANGDAKIIYCDGAGAGSAVSDFTANLAMSSVNITGGSITGVSITGASITGGSITGITDLAVADGGTGASTAGGARSNLGAAASGANTDITSLGGLTTDIAVADGGTGASTAAAARSNLSAAASGANTDITSLTANAMTPSGGTLNVTGNVTASGNVTAYSAAAAKDDIVQIPNALELVQRMRGVSFRWKHEDQRTLGLIYEEVREAVPELTRDENGMVSVMYQNTVALLIEAVKTLKAEINELKGHG